MEREIYSIFVQVWMAVGGINRYLDRLVSHWGTTVEENTWPLDFLLEHMLRVLLFRVKYHWNFNYVYESNGFLVPPAIKKAGPYCLWGKGVVLWTVFNARMGVQICRTLREMRGRLTVLDATSGSLYRSQLRTNQIGAVEVF